MWEEMRTNGPWAEKPTAKVTDIAAMYDDLKKVMEKMDSFHYRLGHLAKVDEAIKKVEDAIRVLGTVTIG